MFSAFILKEDQDIYYHHRRQLFETGAPQACDLRMQKPDGAIFWAHLTAVAAQDAKGESVCHIVLGDITARKQAEDALVQKNAALRELVEQMGAEKGRIHDDIVANMEEVVIPLLNKLRLKGASRQYVKLLEHHLRALTSPYARHVVTGKARHLTPRETEICNMIKSGLPSKDIAEMLGVACQTVQRHRRNIRRRLGLTGKKQNLTSFLADA
jgi:DNA-binding NarL/FixJ family response regulator